MAATPSWATVWPQAAWTTRPRPICAPERCPFDDGEAHVENDWSVGGNIGGLEVELDPAIEDWAEQAGHDFDDWTEQAADDVDSWVKDTTGDVEDFFADPVGSILTLPKSSSGGSKSVSDAVDDGVKAIGSLFGL